MIYSVHGYYQKIGGRKAPGKIEALVFATSSEAAQRLVETLFDGYPAELQDFSVIGGMEKDVQKYIHNGRSWLVLRQSKDIFTTE